jgi:hypothetical protein
MHDPSLELSPSAPDSPALAEPAPAEPAPDAFRAELRERLLAARLPRGMRENLAQSLPAIATAEGATAQIDLAELLPAIESAIPANWLQEPAPQPQEHPAGEAFFTGEGSLTDQQASQIARDQLKRHGFLAAT